ncbi:MAG: DMT family transporter [Breznakibacter sp.]
MSFKVFLALLFSMVFWSFSFVWTKVAFESFPPMTLVLARLVISSVLLVVILLLIKQFQKLHRHDLKYFLLLAFFEPFLYFVGESHGLKLVSSTMGAVVIATIPVFSPIAGYLFFREKLTWSNLLAIVFSFAGVLLIVFESDFSLKVPIAGLLLLFLAVFSAIGYATVLKKIPSSYNAFNVIMYQNMIGALYFIPVFFIFDYHSFSVSSVTQSSLQALLMLAVFASTLAFILFTFGVRQVGVVRANIWVNTIPVFTAIISWMVLDEVLTVQKMVGIFVVVGGVMLSQIKRKTGVVND